MAERQDKIRILTSPIALAELQAIAKERFGDMVKAVADIEQGIMAIGAELHADEEAVLLDNGSQQKDLWGFNIYIDQSRNFWIEYDSMINLRPSQGNRTRSVEDEEIRKKINNIVKNLLR